MNPTSFFVGVVAVPYIGLEVVDAGSGAMVLCLLRGGEMDQVRMG